MDGSVENAAGNLFAASNENGATTLVITIDENNQANAHYVGYSDKLVKAIVALTKLKDNREGKVLKEALIEAFAVGVIPIQ